MKPEFALALTFDGIALLIRGAGGWRRVGEVSTDVEDLPTELAILRARAEELTEQPLRSKLILPDAQIRYLTVDTGEISHDARIKAARNALEGATPYAVGELAFDISPDGARTHVAAIAIETLEEAESFASEHGFGPVSFVAAPGPQAFLGEPFFGTARAVRGLEVEPDGIAVVEIGPLSATPQGAPEEETQDSPPADAPAPETTPETRPETSPRAADAADTQRNDTPPDHTLQGDTPQGETVTEDKGHDDIGHVAEPDLYAADALEAELAPRAPSPFILPAAPPLSAVARDDAGSGTTSGDDTSATSPPAEAGADGDDADSDHSNPAIGFSSRRQRSSTPARLSAKRQAPTPAAGSTQLLIPTADTTSGRPQKAPAAPLQTPAASRPAGAALPAAPNLALPTPVLAHTTSAPAKPTVEAAATLRPISPPDGDIARMPQANPVGARPLRIGVAAAALAAVSAIGAWAVVQELPELWSDLKRADLVETDDPVAPPVLAQAQPQTTASLLSRGFAPPAQSEADAPVTPVADAALAGAASTAPGQPGSAGDEQAFDEDGATPAQAPTQAHAQHPETTAQDLTMTDAAVLEALSTPVIDEVSPLQGDDLVIASLPAPRDVSGEAAATDQSTESLLDLADLPPDEAPLDPEALADGILPGGQSDFDVGQDPDLNLLEQAAQYAATGIWQQVPEIAELPALVDLDDVYVASIDNTDLFQDAVALPAQTAIDTDTPFGAVSSPTEAGRQFDLDDRGLVAATSDGTLNPDGVMIFSGRPAKVPPPTPDRPSARELAQEQEEERIAQMRKIRPRTRPGDLVEQNERAQLGGVLRADLLSKRPQLRPASLKTEAQESQPATALAVARAPQPRARPANFANIVDRAQRRQQRQVQTAAAAPAVVAPSLPSSASVARQATVERALNLRRLNLIGVYGKPSDRRALVRLPSGRYVKVKVGDRIDGGRIVAIGDGQLQYQKGGRNTTLAMPKG